RRARHAGGLLRQRAQEGRDQGRQAGDHEERSPGDPGRLPRLRDENLQDRETRLEALLELPPPAPDQTGRRRRLSEAVARPWGRTGRPSALSARWSATP